MNLEKKIVYRIALKETGISSSAESVVFDLEPIYAARKKRSSVLDFEVFELERDLLVRDCDRNLAVLIVFVLFVIDLRLTEIELS